MPTPVWKSHVGLALETSYGTTQAAPTVWIPTLSYDQYEDDQGLVEDEAFRANASKLQAVYSGVQKGQTGYTFPYYPNECARLIAGILGADTIGSSSNGSWQHALVNAATPYGVTIFDFYGLTPERQFVGAQMDSLNLKFDRASGTLTAKAHWISNAPSTGIAETNPNYTSVPPFRGWEGVFAIGGTTKATLLAYDITLARPVELIFAGNNSQRASDREIGRLDVTGKLSFYGSTDGVYTDYRANTQQALDLVLTDTAAGSSGSRLELLMTKGWFKKVTPDRSGEFLRWDADIRGIYNATDGGPIQVLATTATSSSLST